MRAMATSKCRTADFKSLQMRYGYIAYSKPPLDRHNPNKWDSSAPAPLFRTFFPRPIANQTRYATLQVIRSRDPKS